MDRGEGSVSVIDGMVFFLLDLFLIGPLLSLNQMNNDTANDWPTWRHRNSWGGAIFFFPQLRSTYGMVFLSPIKLLIKIDMSFKKGLKTPLFYNL